MATLARWTRQIIASEKAAIKAELAAFLEKGHKARFAQIQAQLLALGHDETPLGSLRRYIYAVSGLMHHVRFGGVSRQRTRALARLASMLLALQGIESRHSRLGFLHGELHAALSQVHRKNGLLLESAWEQQIASQLSGRVKAGGDGYQALARGMAMLRLGHARLACAAFDAAIAAESASASAEFWELATLARINAKRLSGAPLEARALANSTELARLSPKGRQELAWHLACIEAQVTGDLAPILALVRVGRTHHEGAYVIEGFLWTRVVSSKRWFRALPYVRTMLRSKKLAARRHRRFAEAALVLETCYDAAVPLAHRLKNLGEIIAGNRLHNSVDKELLFLAGMTRWLARSKGGPLFEVVLAEYIALSRRLSDGEKDDVLNLMDDLIEPRRRSFGAAG